MWDSCLVFNELSVLFLQEREFIGFFISFNKDFIVRIMSSCFIYHLAVYHSHSSVVSLVIEIPLIVLRARLKIARGVDDIVKCCDVVK